MSTDEQVKAGNPSGFSAAQQGSDVPLAWKPSLKEPVPVVRCVAIKKDGERCKRWSLRGWDKCPKHLHGARNLKNVAEYHAAVKEAALLRLIDNADLAVDTLEDLMGNMSGEAIRLKAAAEVLDRAGIRGGYEVKVDVSDVTESPAEVLAKRLSKLVEGAAAVQKLRAESEVASDDVVDAEVVDDSGQLELPLDASTGEHE